MITPMSETDRSEITLRQAQSMGWNAQRDVHIRMIELGHTPAALKTDDGFYVVSRHTSMNGAYVAQNKIRGDHPVLETRVRRVAGQEWLAEIHIKVRTTDA